MFQSDFLVFMGFIMIELFLNLNKRFGLMFTDNVISLHMLTGMHLYQRLPRHGHAYKTLGTWLSKTVKFLGMHTPQEGHLTHKWKLRTSYTITLLFFTVKNKTWSQFLHMQLPPLYHPITFFQNNFSSQSTIFFVIKPTWKMEDNKCDFIYFNHKSIHSKVRSYTNTFTYLSQFMKF